MRWIVRVSPCGQLTAHRAGQPTHYEYQEEWEIILRWKSERPFMSLWPFVVRHLVSLYRL